MEVQTLVFPKKDWTKKQAEKWIDKHDDFKNKGVDEKKKTYRYRQLNPNLFKKESFKTMTRTTGKSKKRKFYMVVGKRKKKKK
mgnify:CR=1 FL=1